MKKNNYNIIWIIINKLSKIVKYKPLKITINILALVDVIIDIVIHWYSVSDLIVTNRGFFYLKIIIIALLFLGHLIKIILFYFILQLTTTLRNIIIKLKYFTKCRFWAKQLSQISANNPVYI